MADIFDSYDLADAWDEMFERPGVPRPQYQALLAALQALDAAELRYRADQLANVFTRPARKRRGIRAQGCVRTSRT